MYKEVKIQNKALFYYIKLIGSSNNSLTLNMQRTMPLISVMPSSKQGQELLWMTSFLHLQINQQATQNKDFQFSISFLLDNSMLPTSHCLSSLDQKSISDSLIPSLSNIWLDLVQSCNTWIHDSRWLDLDAYDDHTKLHL